MAEEDLDAIVRTFAPWHKNKRQLQLYLRQQRRDERVVLVALQGDAVVGYGTVVWQSLYKPFRQAGIPEIVDLNVMTEYQSQGIGTALIAAAEHIAGGRGMRDIGISVEQSPGYAAANRLYPQLGYIPDGRGLDADDNELHLVKKLA
jgi:GNAT superfamily N-acetyltransferase